MHTNGNIRAVRAAAFGVDKADEMGRLERSVDRAVAMVGAEIAVPYAGDAMDLADLLNPASSITTQVIAEVSLGLGYGPLPNVLGPMVRGVKRLFGKADAPSVSRLDVGDIKPDPNSTNSDASAPTGNGDHIPRGVRRRPVLTLDKVPPSAGSHRV